MPGSVISTLGSRERPGRNDPPALDFSRCSLVCLSAGFGCCIGVAFSSIAREMYTRGWGGVYFILLQWKDPCLVCLPDREVQGRQFCVTNNPNNHRWFGGLSSVYILYVCRTPCTLACLAYSDCQVWLCVHTVSSWSNKLYMVLFIYNVACAVLNLEFMK